MRATRVATLCFILAAGPLAAGNITLSPPIDCDLGSDCFVQQYVDHDPTGNAMDFHCSTLSYDAHKGTDFALRSLEQLRAGVDVIAAAPGTVRGMRDGMQDKLYTPEDATRIDGRDCGNGVLIDHEGGWSTQYCHLKQGSVQVRSGDRVDTSTVLGQVGLSGRTQFPHVHMTLRKDGDVVDPFDPDGLITCNAPSGDTLWETPIPYRPGGVLDVGFSDAAPEFDAIKAGQAARVEMPRDAPAIVVYGYVFGGKQGDEMHLQIDGPEGVLIEDTVTLERDQAQLFRAIGKRLRASAWPVGIYEGVVTLIRDGEVINAETGRVHIR